MKKTGLISVEHSPGDPPIETDTDWAAVDALTDEQIEAALRDDPDAAPIRFFEQPGFIRIPNVKKLRERLGLTQEEFAATYRIPVGTLRDWEQVRKNPDAPARAYLTVIAQNPEAVAEWLRRAA
ncbi:MAG: helix-turn-helix domain-containing protein [Terracidiphilus sp.]|nr:helix-turn-helix domain-containing protein [Terracidiphilus sp.]